MKDQNFKNHSRSVPLYHYVAFALVLFALVISVMQVFKNSNTITGLLNALAGLSLVIAVGLALWYARFFALRAQDRAIRAEENFRHFMATGKPLDSRLRMRQIIALRFAGDAEFVALVKRAADENLKAKEIKAAIQNWKADHNRA